MAFTPVFAQDGPSRQVGHWVTSLRAEPISCAVHTVLEFTLAQLWTYYTREELLYLQDWHALNGTCSKPQDADRIIETVNRFELLPAEVRLRILALYFEQIVIYEGRHGNIHLQCKRGTRCSNLHMISKRSESDLRATLITSAPRSFQRIQHPRQISDKVPHPSAKTWFTLCFWNPGSGVRLTQSQPSQPQRLPESTSYHSKRTRDIGHYHVPYTH